MYEELVRALHCCADDNIPCADCPKQAKCVEERNMNSLFPEAADAIEKLANKLCDWCGVCPKERRRPWDCEIMWPNAPIPEVYIEPPKEATE